MLPVKTPRRDPAPSRLRYRLTRLWLRPGFRRLANFGLPMLAGLLAAWTLMAEYDLRGRAMLAYERQQEEIARTEDYIRRNIVGQKTKQAQSRRKRLDKLERLERPSEERTLRLRLSPARRGGNTGSGGWKRCR